VKNLRELKNAADKETHDRKEPDKQGQLIDPTKLPTPSTPGRRTVYAALRGAFRGGALPQAAGGAAYKIK
jgi:hypothetical protein